MKLLVGLGNPGPEYAETRHNVGFAVLERLAASHGIALDAFRFDGVFGQGAISRHPVSLLLPQTFMNRSGGPTAAAVRGLGVDPETEVMIVYDDLDLPFGRLRIRAVGGAGGHRGLGNIQEILETEELARLRFGIGRPPADRDTVEYVLSGFGADESARLEDLLERAANALASYVEHGVVEAANRFNRDAEAD